MHTEAVKIQPGILILFMTPLTVNLAGSFFLKYLVKVCCAKSFVEQGGDSPITCSVSETDAAVQQYQFSCIAHTSTK